MPKRGDRKDLNVSVLGLAPFEYASERLIKMIKTRYGQEVTLDLRGKEDGVKILGDFMEARRRTHLYTQGVVGRQYLPPCETVIFDARRVEKGSEEEGVLRDFFASSRQCRLGGIVFFKDGPLNPFYRSNSDFLFTKEGDTLVCKEQYFF